MQSIRGNIQLAPYMEESPRAKNLKFAGQATLAGVKLAMATCAGYLVSRQLAGSDYRLVPLAQPDWWITGPPEPANWAIQYAESPYGDSWKDLIWRISQDGKYDYQRFCSDAIDSFDPHPRPKLGAWTSLASSIAAQAALAALPSHGQTRNAQVLLGVTAAVSGMVGVALAGASFINPPGMDWPPPSIGWGIHSSDTLFGVFDDPDESGASKWHWVSSGGTNADCLRTEGDASYSGPARGKAALAGMGTSIGIALLVACVQHMVARALRAPPPVTHEKRNEELRACSKAHEHGRPLPVWVSQNGRDAFAQHLREREQFAAGMQGVLEMARVESSDAGKPEDSPIMAPGAVAFAAVHGLSGNDDNFSPQVAIDVSHDEEKFHV